MKNKLYAAAAMIFAAAPVFAQEAAHATVEAGAGAKGYAGLAAALAIGVAALGGALGQGKAVSAALDGIARNPAAKDSVQTPMIVGLALIESLVLFAFVIAFIMSGKA